jgi:predicted dehydrogenase
MLPLGLIASGPFGEAYARALPQLPGVELATVATVPPGHRPAACASACASPAVLAALPSLQAVVLASSLVEPYPLLRRALVHGKHVLAAGPFTLTADQVQRLSILAKQRGRLLMFAEERMLSPSFALLADTTKGATRTCLRYLRLLDVRPRHREGALRLAAVAADGLALCTRLVQRTPRSVSAVAAAPGGGPAEAVFISVVYPGGLVASLQVSLSEDWEARQVVASMEGRTLMLDELDYRTPLRIVSASQRTRREAAGAQSPDGTAWQTGSLALAALPGDPTLEQCRRFADAVTSRRVGAVNAEFWGQVARLWEAAERSMALAGAPVPPEAWPQRLEDKNETPRLYVIRGRGQPAASPSAKPALTLVSV